jgi:hypothetical protein
MSSREAYGISQALINSFLPKLSTDPAEAMRFLSIDAMLTFIRVLPVLENYQINIVFSLKLILSTGFHFVDGFLCRLYHNS